jgi:hypothetical protein
MLGAVQEWKECGTSPAVCRSALNRIEILTTSFGNLYWDFSKNGMQQPVPVPKCLAQADAEVTQAINGFRQGTTAGFRAYDDGLAQFLPRAVDSIKEATRHLDVAEARIRAAQCL